MSKFLGAVFLTLIVTTSIQAQQVASQYAITIQNSSFETSVALPETFDCQSGVAEGFQPGPVNLGRTIPAWVQSAGSGQKAYPYGVIQWTCLPQQQLRTGNPLDDGAYLPPDGQNVVFIGNGLSISQDLGVPLQRGVYTLKFYIANWGYNYPGKVKASISVGQHELCSTEIWALGAWTQDALVCPVPGYLETNSFGWLDFGNGDVVIAFQHMEAWIVLLDEVSLWRTDPAFVHN